ncbi:hypothetical protein ACQE98_16890 [Ornithinimicrobium sp. W1679]|uniref:hypothetical protein n=1 Tax=Ornithinimicrobium sp. W1679 TaxID=3418770 RepID=UPI003CF2E4FC
MNTDRSPVPLLATALLAGTLALGACGETPVETPAQQPATVERPPATERVATPSPGLVQEVPPADLSRSWPADGHQEQVGTAPGRLLTEPTDRLARHVL